MTSDPSAAPPTIVGHEPVLAPRVLASAERLDPALLDRFRSAYVVDVADAVGPLYTMDAGIRPLYDPVPHLVGQALTVKAVPGDNLAVHGALGMIQPGDVLVVDWRGFTGAGACGAGSMVVPVLNGLAGVIVDGAFRDIDEIRALGLPLFGRGVNATSPPKAQVGEINVPIACGGVIIEAGDVVVASAEGAVVVPRHDAERVAGLLAEYVRPASIDDWPVDERRRKSQVRADQYRTIVESRIARTGRPVSA
jgi:4-hydroxy-4-methyl-2-oxoglutarate aldolase